MSAPLSYFVAAIVILGLLAIFAIIVRRVAIQGIHPEGVRGRGPRLGVVDTFSLDRNRQLVIVRRDDVEHLLMIGGTNDILVETNIVRAMSAQVIREQQAPLVSVQPSTAQQIDTPQLPHELGEETFIAPQPQAAMAQQSSPQAPRLKPLPNPTMPQAQPMRPVMEPEIQKPNQQPARIQAQVEMASPAAVQSREALNNAELLALAKRLEESMPQPNTPKLEKPSAPEAQVMQPTQHPISMVSIAEAPPPAQVSPTVQQQPISPQPLQTSVVPQVAVAPQPAPLMPQPVVMSPPQPQPQPMMAQPRAPIAAPPMPAPQNLGPQRSAPVMPQPIMQTAPQPVMPPTPQPTPQPVQQPVMPMPSQPPIAAPKDKQASALDENLRRLLGRKLDPR